MSVKPIRPSEVASKKSQVVPGMVIEAFNELIVKYYTGGESLFQQDDVERLILAKFRSMGTPIFVTDIYDQNWLNVDELFRNAGWDVEYSRNSAFAFREKKEGKTCP